MGSICSSQKKEVNATQSQPAVPVGRDGEPEEGEVIPPEQEQEPYEGSGEGEGKLKKKKPGGILAELFGGESDSEQSKVDQSSIDVPKKMKMYTDQEVNNKTIMSFGLAKDSSMEKFKTPNSKLEINPPSVTKMLQAPKRDKSKKPKKKSKDKSGRKKTIEEEVEPKLMSPTKKKDKKTKSKKPVDSPENNLDDKKESKKLSAKLSNKKSSKKDTPKKSSKGMAKNSKKKKQTPT